MKHLMKLLYCFLFFVSFAGCGKATEYVLTSPAGEISLEVFQSDSGNWSYRLSAYDSLLVNTSLMQRPSVLVTGWRCSPPLAVPREYCAKMTHWSLPSLRRP